MDRRCQGARPRQVITPRSAVGCHCMSCHAVLCFDHATPKLWQHTHTTKTPASMAPQYSQQSLAAGQPAAGVVMLANHVMAGLHHDSILIATPQPQDQCLPPSTLCHSLCVASNSNRKIQCHNNQNGRRSAHNTENQPEQSSVASRTPADTLSGTTIPDKLSACALGCLEWTCPTLDQHGHHANQH